MGGGLEDNDYFTTLQAWQLWRDSVGEIQLVFISFFLCRISGPWHYIMVHTHATSFEPWQGNAKKILWRSMCLFQQNQKRKETAEHCSHATDSSRDPNTCSETTSFKSHINQTLQFWCSSVFGWSLSSSIVLQNNVTNSKYICQGILFSLVMQFTCTMGSVFGIKVIKNSP